MAEPPFNDQNALSQQLKKEEGGKHNFNPEEGKHKVILSRLRIAQYILLGLAILIFMCLALLWHLPIDNSDKREILATTIASLFSALTLTIGFIAGSSIDNK